MSDTDVKIPGKVTKAGPAQRASLADLQTQGDGQEGGKPTDEQAAGAANDAGANGAAANAGQPAAANPDLTDEQLKQILSERGVEFEGGFDALKAKLTQPAAAPVETEEQKKQKESAMEKRILDHYLENGGTPDQYVALKAMASADLTALSLSELKRELKDAGIEDEADIDMIIKERYYQLNNPDDLVKEEEETPEAFQKRKDLAKKKFEYGLKKLNGRASHIQTTAKNILAGLRESVEAKDLQATQEAALTSKVEEVAKKVVRKMNFELGEVNNQKVAPVEYEVTEADIDDVVATLKDPAKRKQYSINLDDNSNLEDVMQLLIRNKILESSLKAVYLEGGNRKVDEFEKRFPGRSAADIGVGGAQQGTGQKGKIVRAGEAQSVGRQPQ